MDDVISKLTAEQALKIVERLGRKGGKLRKAVLTETMNVLTEIDLDETADEVFTLLESIDVQDCWDRSGSSRYDYTSPDEAAAEMIEEELQPSSIKSDDIMNWGSQSRKQLIGWASSSEFIAMSGRRSRSSGNGPRIFQPSWWLPAGQVARTKSRWARIIAMHEFIRVCCPEWAKWLNDGASGRQPFRAPPPYATIHVPWFIS